MEEEWRGVPDCPEYEVSNQGRVRRILPSVNSAHTYPGRILKLNPNRNGYLGTYLYSNGKRFYRKVHQLVAEAFIGPQPLGTHVHHSNGIKIDNCSDNLEYVHGCEHYKAASIEYWNKIKKGILTRPKKYKKRAIG